MHPPCPWLPTGILPHQTVVCSALKESGAYVNLKDDDVEGRTQSPSNEEDQGDVALTLIEYWDRCPDKRLFHDWLAWDSTRDDVEKFEEDVFDIGEASSWRRG